MIILPKGWDEVVQIRNLFDSPITKPSDKFAIFFVTLRNEDNQMWGYYRSVEETKGQIESNENPEMALKNAFKKAYGKLVKDVIENASKDNTAETFEDGVHKKDVPVTNDIWRVDISPNMELYFKPKES